MDELGGMKESADRRSGRGGRPSAGRSGEVDARILDAATRLFLERGFEGTSCDQVALDAHAGKASIYARYANKDALFLAAVRDNLTRLVTPAEAVPPEKPLRDRIHAAGVAIVRDAVQPNTLALWRLIVAEAPRFPEIASAADRILRDGGVDRVVNAMTARAPNVPKSFERATPLASKFVDLVLFPHLMRALLGESTDALMESAPQSIADSVAILSSTQGFDEWD